MKIFLLLLLSLAFAGCGSQPANVCKDRFGVADEDEMVGDVDLLDIDSVPDTIPVPDYNPDKLVLCPLDYVYESIELIKFETNENCIISEISFLEILNDTIYVLDKPQRAVCMFDMSGKFINKIFEAGSGPEEYTNISSISIDDNYIYVYDDFLDKVLKYSHDGNFVSSNMLKFFCQKVMPLGNGDMLCYGRGMHNFHLPAILNYSLWICDSLYSKISGVGLRADHEKTFISANPEIHSYGNRTFHFSETDNTFYELLPTGKIKPLCRMKPSVDYGDEFYSNPNYRFGEMNNRKAYAVGNMITTGKHFIYSLSGNGIRSAFVYHNTGDNKSILFNSAYFNGSQISRLLGFSEPLTVYKGQIVYAQESESFRMVAQMYAGHGDLWEGASDACREFDKKLLESLHDEDNPILVFAKIKDHFD